jgi:hypothetical protein
MLRKNGDIAVRMQPAGQKALQALSGCLPLLTTECAEMAVAYKFALLFFSQAERE